jgi:uncharacterized protein (TIGR03083 family)
MNDPLPPLRASVGRLQRVARGLDLEELDTKSYCTEWTIADVLSHLGSSAVIMRRRLDDALAGTEMPEDFPPGIWAVWDAKSAQEKADDSLVEDARLLEEIEAVPEADRARIGVSYGPLTMDFGTTVALRLNEHALHSWDIEVTFDSGARLPSDAAAVVVDNLGLIARFAAKPTGDEREIRVRTSDPERHFTVRLTPDSAELLEGDAGATPDLELPAEAFCRLVYGRLDPDHSPAVDANGEVLDLLRRVFPGV